MTSRKWIWAVLISLVVVAVLAVSGCALYRYGFMRGAMAGGVGEGLMFQDFKKMPFQGEHMGEGFMFQDSKEMPHQGDAMGEGLMFHDEDMPFMGEHMGEFPQRFQGRFAYPDRGYGSRAVPFGSTMHTQSFASPFSFVLRALFLGLIVWVLYKVTKLFTGGKSWQLSFNSQVEPEPDVEVKPKGRGKAK